jgi:hypothetical protein
MSGRSRAVPRAARDPPEIAIGHDDRHSQTEPVTKNGHGDHRPVRVTHEYLGQLTGSAAAGLDSAGSHAGPLSTHRVQLVIKDKDTGQGTLTSPPRWRARQSTIRTAAVDILVSCRASIANSFQTRGYELHSPRIQTANA